MPNDLVVGLNRLNCVNMEWYQNSPQLQSDLFRMRACFLQVRWLATNAMCTKLP